MNNLRRRIELILRSQAVLNIQERLSQRRDHSLYKKLFGLDVSERSLSEYSLWDNTTCSMALPLLELISPGSRALEVGTGPFSTLAIFLAKQMPSASIFASDVFPRFLVSARESVTKNQVAVNVIQSDMLEKISGTFDCIFMNPPYVSTYDLHRLGIVEGTDAYQAGCGGEVESTVILQRLLTEARDHLNVNGKIIIGINNRYLSDERVVRCITTCNLRFFERFYEAHMVPPYSQVYIIFNR